MDSRTQYIFDNAEAFVTVQDFDGKSYVAAFLHTEDAMGFCEHCNELMKQGIIMGYMFNFG